MLSMQGKVHVLTEKAGIELKLKVKGLNIRFKMRFTL